MNRDDRDVLAAEYVLGTLDEETRQRVGFDLQHDRDLQAAVRQWEERLAPLDEGETAVEPPAGLWDRIAQEIETQPQDGAETFVLTIKAEEGTWEPCAEGVERKVLLEDAERGTRSSLLRFAPGGRLPWHPHNRTEECIMLAGEVQVGSLRLAAGDFHAISAGTRHPDITSETGGLVYVRGALRKAAG